MWDTKDDEFEGADKSSSVRFLRSKISANRFSKKEERVSESSYTWVSGGLYSCALPHTSLTEREKEREIC